MALWWQAHGHSYGIPKSIDDDLRLGGSVIVNVSRAIVAEAKARYRNVKVINVTAPADVLAARLSARKRDSDVWTEADLVIENIDTAEAGAAALLAFVQT